MVATTMNDIEKIYCNTHNHDVKAPVVYGDNDDHLYADAEHTNPVDYRLLEELFDAGVVIVEGMHRLRAIAVEYGDDGVLSLLTWPTTVDWKGYDTEIDDWQHGVTGPV